MERISDPIELLIKLYGMDGIIRALKMACDCKYVDGLPLDRCLGVCIEARIKQVNPEIVWAITDDNAS